jgi:hypothetical protein
MTSEDQRQIDAVLECLSVKAYIHQTGRGSLAGAGEEGVAAEGEMTILNFPVISNL